MPGRTIHNRNNRISCGRVINQVAVSALWSLHRCANTAAFNVLGTFHKRRWYEGKCFWNWKMSRLRSNPAFKL